MKPLEILFPIYRNLLSINEVVKDNLGHNSIKNYETLKTNDYKQD